MRQPGLRANIYTGSITVAGSALLLYEILRWQTSEPGLFIVYMLAATLASPIRLRILPDGRELTAGAVFHLIGAVQMSLSEALALGIPSVLAGVHRDGAVRLPRRQKAFEVGVSTLAAAAAYAVYHAATGRGLGRSGPLPALLASTAYFLTITVLEAAWADPPGRLRALARGCLRVVPNCLASAVAVWGLTLLNRSPLWPNGLVAVPAIHLVVRSYRSYLARLAEERQHVRSIAQLHLRTIEALATAIEAKDAVTHDHLRRVRVYALEIGKELGLTEPEMNALRAAALLHDIGKLAVPEHIISKPGRLTPEEFEKVKIHPVVGGQIVEQVEFPFPVAPIVRAHHENWDGSGYPDGLKGEQIPIGGRILAAVDCLDALASDRQYRRALPMDEAMAVIASQAGKNFDPRVVSVLLRKYKSLEPLAREELRRPKLAVPARVRSSAGPAAGYEAQDRAGPGMPALVEIAAACQEAHVLFELAQELGASLSLDETLSLMAARLKRTIPYDAIAIYLRRGDGRLAPAYINGEGRRIFESLDTVQGEGPSGWAAENSKPILNGDAMLDAPGLKLQSALAMPLEGISGPVGVLTLYRAGKDAFKKDHLRLLLAISSKVSLTIENSLKYRQAESSATIDYLTNLPNARSLFLRLEAELARCRRNWTPLAIVVGDLDGLKALNDRLGHIAGNRILRAVGQALRQNCRVYDYVARMGGDEFVMIFPGLTSEAAAEKMAQLQESVARSGGEICGPELLTMSMGAAAFPEDAEDPEQLLAEADRRMYKAKEAAKHARPA